MKTLDDLIKELGLTPSLVETDCGRLKDKNGISLVVVFESDKTYFTTVKEQLETVKGIFKGEVINIIEVKD